MHAENVDGAPIEVESLLNVDDGRSSGRTECRSDDSRVSVFKIL